MHRFDPFSKIGNAAKHNISLFKPRYCTPGSEVWRRMLPTEQMSRNLFSSRLHSVSQQGYSWACELPDFICSLGSVAPISPGSCRANLFQNLLHPLLLWLESPGEAPGLSSSKACATYKIRAQREPRPTLNGQIIPFATEQPRILWNRRSSPASGRRACLAHVRQRGPS